jgi:TPR repeat protein
LAAYLKDGEIVPKNLNEALRLFMLAAGQGLPDAQYELGIIYEEGTGVDRNIEEAIRYYRLAANAEDEEAKAALARLGRPFVNTRDRSRTRKRKQRKTRKN